MLNTHIAKQSKEAGSIPLVLLSPRIEARAHAEAWDLSRRITCGTSSRARHTGCLIFRSLATTWQLRRSPDVASIGYEQDTRNNAGPGDYAGYGPVITSPVRVSYTATMEYTG